MVGWGLHLRSFELQHMTAAFLCIPEEAGSESGLMGGWWGLSTRALGLEREPSHSVGSGELLTRERIGELCPKVP